MCVQFSLDSLIGVQLVDVNYFLFMRVQSCQCYNAFCVVTKNKNVAFCSSSLSFILQEYGQEHSKLSGSPPFNASPMRQTSTPVNPEVLQSTQLLKRL